MCCSICPYFSFQEKNTEHVKLLTPKKSVSIFCAVCRIITWKYISNFLVLITSFLKTFVLFFYYVHLSVTILVTISFELSLQTAFYTFFSYFSFRVSLCHLLFNFWMGGNQLGNTAVIRGLQLVVRYGNTGCGVFKRGVQNQNQHTQRKLLNFENWINGEPQQLEK